jgi:hypothetical protein
MRKSEVRVTQLAVFAALGAFAVACGGGADEAAEEGAAAADSAAAAAPAAGAPTAPAAGGGAMAMITSPAEGDTVAGPDVTITLDAMGVTIVPASDHTAGTGHHHLFVDGNPTPMMDTIPRGVTGILHLGQGQKEMVIPGLSAGPHRVIAVIGDFNHTPLAGQTMDTVNFFVRAPMNLNEDDKQMAFAYPRSKP